MGESFEDLIFVSLPRLPRPGEEIRTGDFVRTHGGGALITAVAAARLGVRSGILSAVSGPASELLGREGVVVRNLRREDEPWAVTAALSTGGERSFVTFNGANDVLEPRLLKALRSKQAPARHVHFAFCPRRCADWVPIVERLRRARVTTSWDFGFDERLRRDTALPRLAAAVDVLSVNALEARLLSGKRSLAAAAACLRSRTRATLLKLGARGSRWLSGTADVAMPAPRVRVVDTTGAGDACNAGFLTAYLQGRDPAGCLRLANRIGALSTRAAGGILALPRRREVA